jgi:hypothetical protein
MLEATETLVSVPTRSEGARKESAGDNVGRAKEKGCAQREEARQAEEGAVELARQKTAADKAIVDAAAAAEAEQARADEAAAEKAAAEEATTSEVAADKITVEEAVAGKALSGQTSHGESHEVTKEPAREALTGVGAQGSQEEAAQASSDAAPSSGAGTDMPALEERVGEVTEPTNTGADVGPGDFSHESPQARTRETSRREVTISPKAATKCARRGGTSAAPSGSSVGSQSSAGRL